jgi:hypothetical protein
MFVAGAAVPVSGRMGVSMKSVISAALILLSAGAIAAQDRRRTLDGTWTNGTVTPLQRPAEFASKPTLTPEEATAWEAGFFERALSNIASDADRLQQIDFNDTYLEVYTLDRLRTALITDPSDGQLPPFLPSARPAPQHSFDDPESLSLSERCLLPNVPGVPHVPTPIGLTYFKIVQTAQTVMIHAEAFQNTRVVRLNAAHLAPSLRRWLGDSVGRWEGATLVVDTTNFRPDYRFQRSGERLHVVERFTPIDDETFEYRFTVEDPDTWAQPWSAEVRFRRTEARLFEAACHEGDHDRELMLRGARYEEKSLPRPSARE